jgi:hypothetical protein
MSTTQTNTSTFTVTHAEYLSSKIAADLKQMQAFYGNPDDARIDRYIDELVILFKAGYLLSVDYGFRKNNKWVLAVSYEVNQLTGSLIDNNPGRVPAGEDISGTTFGSYLRKTQKFFDLSSTAQQQVNATLPFNRGDADDPLSGLNGSHDKTYSAGNTEVKRKIIK